MKGYNSWDFYQLKIGDLISVNYDDRVPATSCLIIGHTTEGRYKTITVFMLEPRSYFWQPVNSFHDTSQRADTIVLISRC